MTDLERVREALLYAKNPSRDAAEAELYAHLKADAADHQKMREDQNELARLREVLEDMQADNAKLTAENTRLREERDKLHALYNRAQDDASREAEIRVNQGFELARLREERDLQFDNVIALSNERDDLLAALRNLLDDTQHDEHHCTDPVCPVRIARAAIEEADNG